MTLCTSGEHEFPVEDETGAYCQEHGVTLLWNPTDFAWDDLLSEPGFPRRAQESTPGATPSGS
ncbi:hypothetical protein JK361_10205 [Streptomyces sp. 5-8]|uniref:Uncharacterized protein n=1 Tax=Streptomyces musisoli TaxID=2802280 RepID=A0ABS1NXY7_9ACTN|nr:hypothetical protein [Streptomyces musisoli]MBL1104961.1 hypothetical protein [Streptomyces musisoli]